MTLEGLPQEAIRALLEKADKPKNVRRGITRHCEVCNSTLKNGYCVSIDCTNNPYSNDTTRECEICGCCERPGKCAWAIVCPVCGAGIGLHCNERGRLVGIHNERWVASGR